MENQISMNNFPGPIQDHDFPGPIQDHESKGEEWEKEKKMIKFIQNEFQIITWKETYLGESQGL